MNPLSVTAIPHGCRRVVYTRHKTVLGTLDWREGSGGTVEIFDLAVASDYRRQKIGRWLVGQLLASSPRGVTVWAITRPDNHIACCFYSSLSFSVLARLPDFYGEGEDGLVYGFRNDYAG